MSDEAPTAKETFAGSKLEIDAAGDYIIDTNEALGGDVRMKLAPGRAFCIEIGGVPVFEVSGDGSQVKIDLGGRASERLVLGEALKALLNDFFLKYDTHIHTTPMGPSSPPLVPSGAQVTDTHLSNVARTKQS